MMQLDKPFPSSKTRLRNEFCIKILLRYATVYCGLFFCKEKEKMILPSGEESLIFFCAIRPLQKNKKQAAIIFIFIQII